MSLEKTEIMKLIIAIWFSVLSMVSSTCQTGGTEQDLGPAFNKELIIPIGEDSIAAYALIAQGDSYKETIILIQGYPGNDTNFDIAQELRSDGRNVILFNHRGAWGSQGIYSYSNCLQDVQEVIRYLSKHSLANELRIDTDEFILIGRSYGAGIALIQGSQIEAVKKIISISATNYGEIMMGYQSLEELGSFKRYMQKQIMINHNIDSFLQELLDYKEEYNIVNYADQLQNKKVLHIEDSTKNESWIKQLEHSTYIVIDSDHNFVAERTKLKGSIINWLNKPQNH